METMDDFKDELEASFRQIREGDIITGTVIAVSEEEITLDLKYYAQGIIKVEDFSNDPDFAVLEQIHAGDEIEATVVKTDDGQGNILLSRKEANDVLAWEKLQQMMEDGTVVKVRIKESVPSGVVTFLEGIRAFIPASQLALDYVENTEEWIGKEVEAKVITVDPEKEKLVLSAKQVAKEAAIEERNHKISMIVPGNCNGGNGGVLNAIWCIYQSWQWVKRTGAHLTDLRKTYQKAVRSVKRRTESQSKGVEYQ